MDRSAVSCQRLLTAVIAVVFVVLVALAAPSISIDEGIRNLGRPLLQASSSKQIPITHVPVTTTLLVESIGTSPIIVKSEPLTSSEFSGFGVASSNCDGSRAPPTLFLPV